VLSIIIVEYSGTNCEEKVTVPTDVDCKYKYFFDDWTMGVVCDVWGAELFRRINYTLSP